MWPQGPQEHTGHYLHIKEILTPTPPQGSLTNTEVREPVGRRSAEVRGASSQCALACTEHSVGPGSGGAERCWYPVAEGQLIHPCGLLPPQGPPVLHGDCTLLVGRRDTHGWASASSLSSCAVCRTTREAVSRANLGSPDWTWPLGGLLRHHNASTF